MSASKPKPEKQVQRARAAHLGPERRRPQILDVAFELFLSKGYKQTSMDEIARAAGVSKPVVYACFPSKAELFGELLDREEQRMLAQFGAALATGTMPLDDPEATLTAGFTSMLRAVTDTPEAYRIALLGGDDAEVAIETRVRQRRERHAAAIAAVALTWMEGSVPAPRIEAAAQFVGQMLVGIGEAGMRMLLTAPELWTPETLGSTLGRFAASGFAALLEG
ncbi:MAG TPA: helix-turn-helix domain-containing protein [Solirubrobacteraceae bacterium]